MSLLYWTNRCRFRSRQSLRIRGENTPRVDLLLPCCGEDLTIITDTIKTSVHLDYPPSKLRLLILDDGNSKVLKAKVDKYRLRYDPLEIHYVARGEFVRFHSKAANLHHGIEFVRDLPQGAAPFFAVLDIDMLPERQWLRSSVPMLLQDNQIALVNTPQRWYNIPKGFTLADRCIHNQDLGEQMLDVSGNANCVGTGFVARRAAFDQIGGYPHRQMEDDTVVPSLMLKSRGWTIAQLPESMQFGIQVVRYNDIVKQAAKWMMGHLATVGVAFGPEMRRAPLQKKLGMIFTVYNWGLSRMCSLVAVSALPAIAFSGMEIVVPGTPTNSKVLLSLTVAWQASLYIQGWLERHASRRRLALENDRRLWVLPYEGKGALQLLEMKVFGCKNWTAFRSTGAEARRGGDPLQNSTCERIWHILWADGAYIHAFYLALLVFGIYKSVRIAPLGSLASLSRVAYPPFAKIAAECMGQAVVPFQYAIFAPPLEERDAYLVRDEDSKVPSPLADGKEHPTVSSWQSYRYPVVVMAYYAAVFAMVWFL